MGAHRSEPPGRSERAASAEPLRVEIPAWLDEVVSAQRQLASALHASSGPRRVSGRAGPGFATLVQSGAPQPMPPSSGGVFADLLKVGEEAPGRYTYLSPEGERGAEIGRGGIGRVLLVMDAHLGREVAIKELLQDEAGVDSELMTRFLAEARITGQLEHPNIVPVYELGRRADGRLYYTMRMVRGETLSAALERARTLADRLALLTHFAGLCNAIAYAHSRGVVHRDIKPDNVMIGEFGETVVLDWGMAKVRPAATASGGDDGMAVDRLEHFDPDVTMEGSLCGTPTHMSPEQARGALDEIDERSDVWALGVVLY